MLFLLTHSLADCSLFSCKVLQHSLSGWLPQFPLCSALSILPFLCSGKCLGLLSLTMSSPLCTWFLSACPLGCLVLPMPYFFCSVSFSCGWIWFWSSASWTIPWCYSSVNLSYLSLIYNEAYYQLYLWCVSATTTSIHCISALGNSPPLQHFSLQETSTEHHPRSLMFIHFL